MLQASSHQASDFLVFDISVDKVVSWPISYPHRSFCPGFDSGLIRLLCVLLVHSPCRADQGIGLNHAWDLLSSY